MKRERTVGVLGTPGVGGLGEKGGKYPRSPCARKGLCKQLPLSARVHKQNNFVSNEGVLILQRRREFIVLPLNFSHVNQSQFYHGFDLLAHFRSHVLYVRHFLAFTVHVGI